jgi:hypothetical protein
MTGGSRYEMVSSPRSVGGFHGVWACSGVFQALSLYFSGLPGNGTSHGSGGEEVTAPSPLCNILNVGFKWSIQFYLYGINSEVLNCSPCSLGL